MGELCTEEERNTDFYGFTWVHGNKIQYGGGNNDSKPSILFNWTSTPYYLDQNKGEETRIFIKDKDSKKPCYQIFEKNTTGKDINPESYIVDETDKWNRFYT